MPRRFYAAVTTVAEADGHILKLDGRAVRTPGKRVLTVRAGALATALAAEWAAQGERIDPATMPLTRLANTVVDGVVGREPALVDDLVAYAGHDLVCYRAEGPAELAARQAEHWDPLIAWAETALGSRFVPALGIMPVTQPEAALAGVRSALAPFDAFRLAALHVMTTLMGSCLLALAHATGHLTLKAAWTAAHVDEDWQIARWGEVPEATARRARRRQDMEAASRFLALAT